VLLPHENDRVYALRPLVGLDEEEVLVHKELANRVGYVLPMERVTPAEFPWPGAQAVRDAASARLLVEAARLTLREGAAPLRALGRISIRPRPYQLVPLLMALRLDPVRLFIADDVGVGKTIEALLIARELLERGEIQRFAVLCPPALCDQWAREIQDKFNLEPVIIRTGTLSQLETLKPPEYQSVYEYFPVQVISIDFVKTERNRHQFLIFAPELIIVDEAHGCARIGPKHQQQRYELLYDLVKNPQRQPHMIFLTATPHSGIEEAFRSLLGLLRPELETWDLDNLTAAQRAELARHFVQRTRRDIQDTWEEATDFRFPERVTEDVAYTLSELYHKLFEAAYGFCAGIVRESKGLGKREQRVRYWGALSLLRCVMSSPAAAIAALQRQVVDEPGSNGPAGIAALDEASDEYESIWARHVFEPTEEQADDETPVPPIEEAARQLPTAQRNILHQLLTLSQEIIETGQDTKLQKATQLAKRLLSEGFHPIFWCRYVATAEYLAKHLRAQLGPEVEVVPITGRMSDEERRIRITEIDPEKPRILVSTDCLSEGVNLQDKFTAVVHYDLPWNPNRLEQREGRVDRFGQPAPRVKAIRFYGQDNPIDGIVIKVLLEKARTIHKTLGIYVPVPEESESVTQAVLEALFLKGRWGGRQLELGFDVERIDRVRELHQTWEEKSTAEKRRRTLFAQGALRPEEVYQEIKAVDAVLGDPEAVRLFVLNATQRIGLPIRPDKRRKGVYRVSLDPAMRETLPPAVEAALPRRRGAQEWLIAFQSPTPEGADYVGRNHPFVATLARHLFEQALLNPNTELVARVGALRTRRVPTLTTILLLRVRYLLTQKNITPRLAEEIILLGYREEAGGSIQPLSRYEASQLFAEAQPDDNMPLTERQELIERALSQVKPWTEQAFEGGTLSPVGEAVRAQINERAAELTDAHRRLRQAMREAQRDLRLVPVFPPDLLGIVVLQPLLSP